MAPPGRRSIRQYGSVKPFGPHQRSRRSGSVHALKTSSRGASKTRVMTSSPAAGFLAALGSGLLAAMLLLVLQLTQIVVQAIEALLPEVAIGLHPVGDLLQRTGGQPAGAPLGPP